MSREHQLKWIKTVSENEMAYPCEYVIRIFKGSYPRLNLDKASFRHKKICDIGCGDGRNLGFLKQCGFEACGVEVDEVLVRKIRSNLEKIGASVEVKTGLNNKIPYPENHFDYILSWNACYYLEDDLNFDSHVKEFARILKPGGYLVLSIPKKSCFIYKGSETMKPGYQIIKNDPFGVRNGEVLRMFEDEEEIQKTFSGHFKNFVFGSIEDDCFGYNYHWHLAICQKK